jgi:hypothetical protein
MTSEAQPRTTATCIRCRRVVPIPTTGQEAEQSEIFDWCGESPSEQVWDTGRGICRHCFTGQESADEAENWDAVTYELGRGSA